MAKKYKIINDFFDNYTGEKHTIKDEPKEFSDERVEEIRKEEKAYGYPLIDEGQEIVEENNIEESTNIEDKIDNNKKTNNKK